MSDNLPRPIPSPDEIRAARTGPAGWKKETLAGWGVPWPPPKGWRRALERQWEEANKVRAKPDTPVRSTGRTLVVEFDGGSRANPGIAGYGATVRDAGTRTLLAERWGNLGVATNNVAEYTGLIRGLEAALAIDPAAHVVVRGDSKLVIEQMVGRWKAKDARLRDLRDQAKTVAAGHQVQYTWVPREANKKADALSNEGMDSTAPDGRRDHGPNGIADDVAYWGAVKDAAARAKAKSEYTAAHRQATGARVASVHESGQATWTKVGSGWAVQGKGLVEGQSVEVVSRGGRRKRVTVGTVLAVADDGTVTASPA